MKHDTVVFTRSDVTAPRRRVLFVTNMWPDDATPHYGTFVKSQADSLEHEGLAVDVLYIRGYVSRASYLVGRRRLLSLASARHYDLIHVHTGHVAAVAVWGLKTPVIVSFVGGDLLGHPNGTGTSITLKSRVEARVFREVARRATATITKSREMEKALPRSVRKRNTVLPNGVDLERFAPRDRSEARSVLGLSQEEKIVLFVGDPDDPRKNLALARGAVELCRERDPTIRLHVAWKVAGEAIPTLLAAADCLAFSSLSEGSPNVVKEAMAAALPIVATPVGDVQERIGNVAGCFIATYDVEAFAMALRRALSVGHAPEASAAVKSVSLDAVSRRLVALYDEIISE